ncbi:MAG: glycerol-3-phosphate transporter, partial [Bacteroidales bacterium 43_8]
MLKLFQPAPVIDPLPKERVDKEYKKLRLQVFLGIFIGYAGYYLVRKNFSIAMPALEQMGFDKADLGWALSAVSIAYGISKFVMGTVSDHSNARVFIPLGLIASAVIMTVMGLIPWTVSSLSIMLMFCILFVNGWVQGMGWPPCGRVMVHWFSVRERGVKMSIWNIAHNVGGALMAPLAVFGITIFGVWGGAFYFPAMVAVVIAVIAYLLVRDTPQSCGLPPIELYKPEECTQAYSAEQEKELSTKEILFGHVFNNKLLWIIAFANAFIYFVRYGVLDWAPMYLEQVKHMDLANSSWSYFAFEIAGIFGTILCGWLSDKVFKGRRGPVTIIYMLLVMLAVYIYWNSASAMVTNVAMAAIGFLIYGPVMLIGVSALDLVPKKAAGTAAG